MFHLNLLKSAAKFQIKIKVLGAITLAVFLSACSTPQFQALCQEKSIQSLRFIGEQSLPYRYEFKGSSVGGLSGIDYDPMQKLWIMVSDDRSEINPARFYSAKLQYDLQRFSSVELKDITYFKQKDGELYPNAKEYPKKGGEVPDFEAIRFDPLSQNIWYTSEGNRKLSLDPFIKIANRNGNFVSLLPALEMFQVHSDREYGSRNNFTYEGLSFSPDGKTLWLAMETAIYQDGAIASLKNPALSRISKISREGQLLAQFAYPVDAIPLAPAEGKFSDNGISEILAINDHQLLVIERAGVQAQSGVFDFYIRIYLMEINGATDVNNLPALVGADFIPVQKRLLLNLNTLGLKKIDNLEGIAFGAKLENGHDSLVLVSDDNFEKNQMTQFLAFEVIPQHRNCKKQ